MDVTFNHLFPDTIEIEHYTTTLFKIYISGIGLGGIVQTVAQLLRNPVIVFDSSFKIVAHSEKCDIDDYIWSENIRKGYCSYDFIAAVSKMDSIQKGKQTDESYEVTCEETSNTKLISKIKVGDKQIGNVLLLGCKHPIQPKDTELLAIAATIIAEEMGKSSYYRNAKNMKVEDFICGLLEQQLQDNNTIGDRMRSAGLKFGKCLLLLLFDLTKYDGSGRYDDYLRERLQHLFPSSPSTYYEGRIVIIHDGDLPKELLHKLQNFLTPTGISLGISNRFSDLTQCRAHYLQSKSAVRIGSILYPDRQLTFYSDIQLYELLSTDVTLNEESNYCHPELLKLREYDDKHHSNLYHTFYVYLKNNRNIQIASEQLYIHRNTLRYKLDHISKLLDTDFLDSEKMLGYYVSYKVAHYYEKARKLNSTQLPVR